MISLGSGLTVAGQTISFVLLLSIGLAAIGFVLAPVLLPLIGGSADSEAIRLAVTYTRISYLVAARYSAPLTSACA
ncbi:MAG: hypothetical protein V5A21_09420, partial [Halapricum sp.]